MFGPNTYFDDKVEINYSHRDKKFYELLNRVRQKFSDKFGLEEYDILFLPGSATLGIEALMYSYKGNIEVVGPSGTFTTRWRQMARGYKDVTTGCFEDLYCLLETSCSQYTESENSESFVDAVSAFPYYDIPEGTKGFVTCLNKQLGSYVGVAVVGVRKDCWDEFKDSSEMSYLNLARYKQAHEQSQTPSTFPTYILEHFETVLDNFDLIKFRQRIDEVSKLIVDTIGEHNIIGDKIGPVITVPKHRIPIDIAKKYELYGYYCDRPNYQFFTYSQDIDYYKQCMKELQNVKKVIAIDFDGTITEDTPAGTELIVKQGALKYIPLLCEKGYRLVLWTARQKQAYDEAIYKLKECDLYRFFDFGYNNCGQTGKLIADFYIDDKSVTHELNWEEVYNYLTKG